MPAMSEIARIPIASEVSGVTTKALVSTAGEGVKATRSRSSRYPCRIEVVSAASPVASLSSPFRNSSMEAAYSGVKLISPLSNEPRTRSRKPPRGWIDTEYPASSRAWP